MLNIFRIETNTSIRNSLVIYCEVLSAP
jgi:hypothetical protein